MKKYLLNRVLRSIFSIVAVMLISVVLIFSLVPTSYVTSGNKDISDAQLTGKADGAAVKTLEVLEKSGYIDYVSQVDYCREMYPDDRDGYSTCVARLDSNPDKQKYLKKYRELGWEEVKLVIYSKSKPETGNADPVTRSVVEQGIYTPKEGEFFSDDLSDEDLYYVDDTGLKKVVTYNNITYFQKKKNPLKVFWDWFTNILTFDHKDKVEDLRQWDPITQTYMTEDSGEKYNITFKVPAYTGETTSKTVNYNVSEEDINLKPSLVTIKKKNYVSIGGVGLDVLEGEKSISSFDVTKEFNNEEDHDLGGKLKISGTFSDNTSFTKEVEVIKYLKNDIPLYGGSDNFLYIGNTITDVEHNYKYVDKNTDVWEEKTTQYDIISFNFIDESIKRGYSVKLDEYGTPALTCVGCEHKYMIYFDNTFPYIHFNFTKISLGESMQAYKGKDTINIMVDKQGVDVEEDITYPTGVTQTGSVAFHTCTYKDTLGPTETKLFTDNYANCDSNKSQSSMIATSFLLGIFSTLVAYFVGVPIGVLMARYKERLFDKIAMVYIIIMFSVPSLVYIIFFKNIAIRIFDTLPTNYEYGNVISYILPIVSLSLGSIASMMMWTRRYIVDQGNSDYVKFARSKGLSETQIFFKHILRNAIVPIAHGIPGSVIGAVAGTFITERLYNVPGTGKLMVDAIEGKDNWVTLGLVLFFSVLSVISLILGDIVITMVDPRISFVDTGGRK